MTSESLASLSDPGGRLVGRWRVGQKGWDCMLEACWYGHRGVFFLPGKNIHPCRWSHGPVLGPDLGQLEGCASGQFSRQSTAHRPTDQPTNYPHNQEACATHTAPTTQPFSQHYSTQFQGTNGRIHPFQQMSIQY